jgi:hypothetical protein
LPALLDAASAFINWLLPDSLLISSLVKTNHMDFMQLSWLYGKASDEAYKAHKHKNNADLAETEEERESEMMWYEISLSALERYELKIQALKLTIPIA